MKYEPLWERFEVIAPGGTHSTVRFLRAGFLTLVDRPELFFFRVTRVAGGLQEPDEDVAVGISGDALKKFQNERRSLSREEKIDITGLLLKKNMEAGKTLDSTNLFIRERELAALAGELGIPE